MVPMSDVTDELDDSPMLEEVLGDALGKLRVFHAKLAEEGEPRGLIGPSSSRRLPISAVAAVFPVLSRPPACRITGSRLWSRWNVVSNG